MHHEEPLTENELAQLVAYNVRRYGIARAVIHLLSGLSDGLDWFTARATTQDVAREAWMLAEAAGLTEAECATVSALIAKAFASGDDGAELMAKAADLVMFIVRRNAEAPADPAPQEPIEIHAEVATDAPPAELPADPAPELPEAPADPAPAAKTKRKKPEAPADPAPAPELADLAPPQPADDTTSVHVVESAELG